MKKILFSFLLLIIASSALGAIRPSSNSPMANDSYFNYQWPLANQGHVVTGDIDDITPYELRGVNWAHIDWDADVDKLMRRDVVVAVIDSGVDIDHEDLKGRIFLNDQECNNGRIPLGETGDPDKNGFEGDCAGWNFSTNNLKRQRLVDDDIGHGTHVAGIIAATSNNQIGLTGLSNRIKILPLKVYDIREEQNKEVISSRVMKAIKYAVSRNVDVINLSLGWPVAADNEDVRGAIDEAEKKGIIVIAAAGNDRHDAQIFPCAYSNVFCVGSIDVNGEVSRFSNFGGHVDILAPGGQILGLIPTTMSSELFGVKGYDIKFGTSQAAPYVSGIAAILKGIFPEIANEEIRSALMASSRKVSELSNGIDVSHSSGLVQLKKSIEYLSKKRGLLTRPSFKELSFNEVNVSGSEAILNIPVLNAGNLKKSDVKIVSLNSDYKLSFEFKSGSLKINISPKNQWANSQVRLKFVIKGNEFVHKFFLAKKVDTTKNKFIVSQNGLLKDLKTIPSPFVPEGKPLYYRFLNNQKTLEIYEFKNNKVQLLFSRLIKEVDTLLDGIGVQRIDINKDGKLDFWLMGVKLDEKGQAEDLRLLFLDHVGSKIDSEIYGEKTSLSAVSDYSLPMPHQARFINVVHPDFGVISIATWLTKGAAERTDQNTDVFDPNKELVGTHINYLWPTRIDGEVVFRVRTLTHMGLLRSLRNVLNLPSWAKFEFLHLRFSDEMNSSDVVALLRTGSGIKQNYYHLELTSELFSTLALAEFKFVPKVLHLSDYQTSIDYSNQAFDSSYYISNNRVNLQTILRGQFSKNKMRTVVVGANRDELNYVHTTNDARELLVSLLKEFHFNNKSVRIYELDTILEIVTHKEGRRFRTQAPIYRTSFVQGTQFSTRFLPLLTNDFEGSLSPALYVDNTVIFSPTFSLWVVGEQAYVPLKFSYATPQNCSAMNPFMENGKTSAVLFCTDDSGVEYALVVPF